MSSRRPRSLVVGLSIGVIVGVLSTAGIVSAQRRGSAPASADTKGADAKAGETAFEIIDTPGSTFLLDRQSGQVWRIGFTEVRGERHWFGTYIPRQDPVTFEEFQARLRQKLEER